MSLASVHPAGMRTLGHVGVRSLSVASSLDALAAHYAVSEAEAARIHAAHCDTVLTIEELRSQTNSCFTCGVSWAEQHVSLDCSECGGYSLQRPCPACDGACGLLWKRDLTLSHACGKARWQGACARAPPTDAKVAPPLTELCRRMSEAAQVAPSS